MGKFNFAWLMLNSSCNLRCSYCYEAKYGFKNKEMTKDVIDSSLKFIKENCAEGSEIGIYGGEPLLSFDLIKYLFTEYPIFNYSLFTNTILMTRDMIDFLSDRQDFLIMDISLDGDRDTQIKNRGVMYDEEIVREIFKKFRHTGVRMIVTDPDKCYDNCVALKNLGAKRIDINYPSFTDFPGEQYIKTLDEQISRLNSDKIFSDDIYIGKPCYRTNEICKIGTDRIAISPEGDIYPCDVFYFVDSYKIGNVNRGIDPILMKRFLDDLEDLKIQERPCPAHVFCRKIEGKEV